MLLPKIVENQLTDKKIRALSDGEYPDGRGLYIIIKKPARSWVLRYTRDGRRRRMGLGPYPDISLKAARDRALDARRSVLNGHDPIEERKSHRAVPTFWEVVEEFHKGYEREVVDAKRWLGRLKANVYDRLAKRRITDINRGDLSELMLEINSRAPGTAHKIGQAFGRVFRFALGREYIEINPWEAAKAALPRGFGKSPDAAKHPMVQPKDAPAFYAALCNKEGERGEICLLALRMAMITSVRSGNVLTAVWDEFDLGANLWRIPKPKTKTKKADFVVPLPDEAISVLKRVRELGHGDLVFPGQRPGRPLSDMTLSKRMKSLDYRDHDGRLAVPHGMRASMRTWAEDNTDAEYATMERALDHAIRNSVEESYNRGDRVDKRRILINEWSSYLLSGMT